MQKRLKLKISREFLKNDFPENILPIRTLSKKDKRLIREKLSILRKIKKRIKKLDQYLQTKTNRGVVKDIFSKNNDNDREYGLNTQHISNKKICFLFSPDQIRYDLLRKQNQTRALSDFLLKLKEKKKFCILYGNISRKFFQKAYLQAQNNQGKISDNLLIQFEARLDVLLYRICFFKSIASARQSINHNLIFVNGNIINISSYQVKPGDIISVNHKKRKVLATQLLDFLKRNLSRRRFRFYISTKLLNKKLKGSYLWSNGRFQSQKNGLNFYKLNTHAPGKVLRKKSIIPLKSKLKKMSQTLFDQTLYYLTERTALLKKTKRTWFLECLLRINFIPKLPLDSLYLLRVKKLMYKKASRQALYSAMKISAMKPLNVEVSYKLLCAVVLFAPQKIVFPATINTDLLSRSLAQI